MRPEEKLDPEETKTKTWSSIMRWSIEAFVLGIASCGLAALTISGFGTALMAVGIPIAIVSVGTFAWGASYWTKHKERYR